MHHRELELRRRLASDFPFYAPRCLTIRPKTGKPVPLRLNAAQLYIHQRLEEQRAETGRVRALILKGRQQGASTLIGGRFYWRVTHERGFRAFIMTHMDVATSNLFAMSERYHDNCPELVRPEVGKSNAKELTFPGLDSGYKVATAGSKGVGRSDTIQLFHGSEVAFWPHADTHASGALQAVPDEPGTEVILESTANGVGGFFHRLWRSAEAKTSDFTAIFVPWFWSAEYAKTPPEGFTLSLDEDDQGESETSYAEAYGLTLAQMYWRRLKVLDLGPSLFRQEYPACAAEAFQMSNTNSLISAATVVRARKAELEPSGPVIIGFDPAWQGEDRHGIAVRRGRKVIHVEGRQGLDTIASATWLRGVIDTADQRFGAACAKAFIDVGGVGAGVYDQLKAWGYCTSDGGRGKIVVPVSFGSPPISPPKFSETTGDELPGALNRRAEMWMNSRDWLEDPAGADIPDLDELQADACSTGYDHDQRARVQLWSKKKMRADGLRSPDLWDAVALTFAEPVIERERPAKDRSRRGGRGNGMGWLGA